MTINTYLSNRLREVLLDGQWIANTNYKEQIQNTTWQMATKKIANLNTIAALTFHINYYLSGILQALKTGQLEIRDQFSFELSPIQTETDWLVLVEEFLSNSEKFADTIENMEEDVFEQAFFDEKYGSFLRNIEGVIEHSYYHLGQISLIKKLIRQEQP